MNEKLSPKYSGKPQEKVPMSGTVGEQNLSMPEGILLSDLVGEFDVSVAPWDDYSEYIPEQDSGLQESTEEFSSLEKLSEARGVAKACRDYFNSTDNPTYEGFMNSPFAMEIGRGYYNSNARIEGVPEDRSAYGTETVAMTKVAPEPEKQFDSTKASKELLKVLDLFNSSKKHIATVESRVEEKYERLYELAYSVAAKKSNSRHALICGDAGIGKTYEVTRAVESGLNPNFELVEVKGDAVGKSITSIIQFFYENRNGKLVVLDDADGVLVVKDQTINNALKAFLDTDKPVFRMSITVNDRINSARGKREKKDESTMSFDLSRIKEGYVSLYDGDGIKLAEEKVSNEDRKFYTKFTEAYEYGKTKKKKNFEKFSKFGLIGRISEALYVEDDDYEEDDDGNADGDTDLDLVTTSELMPIAFRFESRTIFISNLKRDMLSDAVSSRFDIEEISLTNEEFLARLKQIIGTMDVNKDGAHSKEDAVWGKKVVFGLLCVLVEAYETGAKLNGASIALGGKLQFRVVSQLVDKWCRLAEKYREEKNVKDRKLIEPAIQARFLSMYAIPYLENLRDSRRNGG